MTDSFYLTLHSEGESFIMNRNKPEAFQIHLGRTLHLEGKWEVGLVELFYPMTFPIFVASETVTLVEEKVEDHSKMHVFELNPGNTYVSNAALFHALRGALQPLDVAVHNRYGHVVMDKVGSSELEFTASKKLLDVMGLDEIKFDKNNSLHGCRELDVHRALPQQLYVYTDIIHHQMVGTALDKLLRVINVDTLNYQHGCTAAVTLFPVHYHPVCKDKISSVEIYIRDRDDNFVTFNHEPLTVILHFRRNV